MATHLRAHDSDEVGISIHLLYQKSQICEQKSHTSHKKSQICDQTPAVSKETNVSSNLLYQKSRFRDEKSQICGEYLPQKEPHIPSTQLLLASKEAYVDTRFMICVLQWVAAQKCVRLSKEAYVDINFMICAQCKLRPHLYIPVDLKNSLLS